MNKDVIYIDVEDDITAIIGKVKAAKQKIVALVPPKRVGVLQSAVNLRLLSRAATHVDKRLVLITNNQALISLSAAAQIPVARNLQSKPELAQIPALDVDDGEDVIDGATLPVGELQRTADAPVDSSDTSFDAAVKEVEKAEAVTPVYAAPPVGGATLKTPKVKKGKVPNFNAFRKKLFFIILGIILLIAALVWAIFFAPRATIIISAKTTSATVDQVVSLSVTEPNDSDANVVRAQIEEQKKPVSVEFDATGSKEVGEKASGQVVFRNCESETAQTIPSGTVLTADGLTYTTQSAVTVPAASGSFLTGCNPGISSATPISASDIGEASNTSSGTQFSVAGHANTSAQYMRAVASSDIDGGSQRQVKVVSAEDVRRATERLAEQRDDSMRATLRKAFNQDAVVIEESYRQDRGDVVASPAIDQEANGKARLTSEVTYSMIAILRGDLNDYLDQAITAQLDGDKSQRLYDNGSDKVVFSQFNADEPTRTVKLTANGEIGPQIDEQAIKEHAQGKRYGDIQSQIETIQGVNDVDIKFSPFWVSSAPNNPDKITIEFKLENES